ncbi:MAG: hypothetical protein V4608_03385 [Bacteroidota bacterium]
MTEIVLKYDNKEEVIEIADSWNSLSPEQLLYVGEYWESWKLLAENDESLLKVKALLFLELMKGNTKANRKHRIDLIAQANSVMQQQLTELTTFIFRDNKLTKCPIACISGLSTKLCGPNDGLGNITVFEFAFADSLFMNYSSSGDIALLEKLIAILYRPKFLEKRVAFDKDKVEKYLPLIKKMPYAEKQLILLWYNGCRKQIIADHRNLFSSEEHKEAKSEGWLPVILALAGDKFGTFDETGHTDLHVIFMELKALKKRVPKKKRRK